EVVVADDGVHRSGAADQLLGHHLRAGAVLGLRRQDEARVVLEGPVEDVVVVIDPRGEPGTKPFDEGPGDLVEGGATALASGEGDVEHHHPTVELRRRGELAGRPEDHGRSGAGHQALSVVSGPGFSGTSPPSDGAGSGAGALPPASGSGFSGTSPPSGSSGSGVPWAASASCCGPGPSAPASASWAAAAASFSACCSLRRWISSSDMKPMGWSARL